jgi:hypothetical protein
LITWFFLCLFSPAGGYGQGEPSPYADGPPSDASYALSLQGGSSIAAYQVGAFRTEKDAERMVSEIGEKDFYGNIYRKNEGGKVLWVVTVSVSGIPFENLQQELLDAGFASIPVTKTVLDTEMQGTKG